MSGREPSDERQSETELLLARLQLLAERGRKVSEQLVRRQLDGDVFQIPDQRIVGAAFQDFAEALLAEPEKLVRAQLEYWRQMGELWQAQMHRLATDEDPPRMAEPAIGDRRFRDEAWNDALGFDFIKQAYLLSSDWLRRLIEDTDGLRPKTREKVEFYARQFIDAMAPTNFAMTNPQVLRHAAKTKGESLIRGLELLLDDLEKGRGQLQITMTDDSQFRVGENIATSSGAVVFENELMQLLQFAPTTEQAHQLPLLIVPPWINKYYILDLKPQNSFIRFCVDSGLTVFVISWVNPDHTLAEKDFQDYLIEGPIAAMQAIAAATGETKLNVMGYCLGGTLTACLLAYLAAIGDQRIRSATFLTTMTDFSEAGELGVFIDEEQLQLIEAHMQDKGYLEARHMQQVFNMLRANDLIWSFVVNNYLMGREPLAFDLLYWNADSTRMPYMMHRFYLRKMYQENRLAVAGGIELLGQPIDLGRIRQPTYFLSTRDDHIAPWASTYRGARLLGGKPRFVLGGSGHIAGVVNPPSSRKYGYWTNESLVPEPSTWLEQATAHEGSWWSDWRRWLGRRAGRKVRARSPGDGALAAIEPAPGRYVRLRDRD